MSKPDEQQLCPVCRQELIPGNDVCWVCYLGGKESRWPDPGSVASNQIGAAHPLPEKKTGLNVVKTIVGSLLIGLAGGVAAFFVLMSMVMAFIAAILSAFFEICTSMGN